MEKNIFSISWYNYFNKLRKEVINMIFGNLKYADKYDFLTEKIKYITNWK